MSRTLLRALAVCLCACAPVLAQDVPLDEGPILRLPPVEDVGPIPVPVDISVLNAPAVPQSVPVGPTPPPEAVPAPDANPLDEQKIILGDADWDLWSPAWWDPWEGNVELGLSGTEGNTETFNVRFGLTAKHKTETFVQTLQITSIQKSADGATTANTALLDGRLEWPMPDSRWNYFMHGLVEYDQFKAFEYRLSGDTGFGFEFIQNDATTLVGRSGFSASHEIGGPDNAVNPELLFGGEFKHKFNATHSLSGKVEAYPNISDFSDIRINSQASWEIALSAVWGLSLKLSVIDRYDSTPHGAKPNDLDYSTLVLWSF